VARRYFGTDGIRGRVGEGVITPEFVLRLGWAAGRVLGRAGGRKVVIGKDTRISGYMFESALEAGLVAAGINIRLLGPMPTPGIAYLTRVLRADAGIVISASHNPYRDNGIKFFSSTGTKLPDDMEEAIEAELELPLQTVASEQLGKVKRIDDAAGRYIEFCKATLPPFMNLEGLRVVVDCAHGAAYHIAPQVLSELGAQVSGIGVAPDGLNINREVGSTHPETLRNAVLAQKADIGIALDGDADRVILVDASGQVVDGDGILYVIARARHAEGCLRGPVVGTVMSNLGLELALAREGIGFERTQVGDRHILERLRGQDWSLGGEPSGHIICRDRTTTGDGMIAALQVLGVMRATGRSLAELLDGMKVYPQVLLNVSLAGADPRRVMAEPCVHAAVQAVEHELGRGGRVVLRPSGTEPLIRVMVEGAESTVVHRLADQIAAAVRAGCN